MVSGWEWKKIENKDMSQFLHKYRIPIDIYIGLLFISYNILLSVWKHWRKVILKGFIFLKMFEKLKKLLILKKSFILCKLLIFNGLKLYITLIKWM